jgi:hypothetical protein
MHREPHTQTGRDRAQTAQDFAVGIGLFLLAVAFVFAFVPQVVSPYDVGIGASESAQADRAATMIVGNLSVEDRPNELDHDAADDYFEPTPGNDVSVDQLRDRTGLPFSSRINVTVRNVETGNQPWSGGATYRDGQEAASATRIVRTDDPSTCEPACEVVVRVW